MSSSDDDICDSHSLISIDDGNSETIEEDKDSDCVFLSDEEEVIDRDIINLLRAIEQPDAEPNEVNVEDNSVKDVNSTLLRSCLELNNKKQELIKENFVEIQRIVGEIENFDVKVQLRYANPAASNWWGDDHTGRFDIPYFKDKDLFPPPPNQDAITKLRRRVLDTATVLKQNKWQQSHMKLLDNAVHKNAYEILVAPLNARLKCWEDELALKLKHNEDTSEVKEKLVKLDEEIKAITGDPLIKVLSDPNAKIDWMKISATDFDGRRSASECRGMWRMCLMVGVNRKPWTKEETDHLKKVVRCHGNAGWESIAEEVGGRTSYQCFLHYQVILNRDRLKWSLSEDRKLKNLVNKFTQGTKIPFTMIARYMPGRTASNIRQRWRDSLDPSIRTGKFTVREDLILATARHIHDMSYEQITALLPGRTGQQLRARYRCLVNIHPTTAFTPEEDKRLVSLAQINDANWSSLVKEFPKRTSGQLRGRYVRLLKNAKISSRESHKCVIRKSKVWETVKDKIVKQMKAINSEGKDEGTVMRMVKKPLKPIGRKVKHRDRFDREISQIYRSQYAQPKGRKKKHYTSADITKIGEKGRQIADVLKANVNWTPQRENEFQEDSQYHLYSELRKYNENSGLACNGTSLTHCIAPNAATIVGLRTLLMVEPFLLRWSIESNLSEKKEMVHKTSTCGSDCQQLNFEQACELFKQRCLALFLWPMYLSQQGPLRTGNIFCDKQPDINKNPSDKDEVKSPVSKQKMTKSERKRWLKARWQKYREEKDEMVQTAEAGTSVPQATPQVMQGRPGRKKEDNPNAPAVVNPKGKPGRKRKQPLEVPPLEQDPEAKKDVYSTRNKHGKHVPRKF